MIRRSVILLAFLLSCTDLEAQEPQPPSVEDTQVAGESSADPPARRLVKWNEYEGPFFTLRASAGVILDAGTYAQDDESREQFALEPDWQVRDFRVLLNGRIKTRRAITWSAGFMYDAANDEWLVRQTGMMIAVPELKGHVFVGRSKEGLSLNMVIRPTGQRPRAARPALPRGGRGRELADHGRNAEVQHGRRLLPRGLAPPHGVRRRT